tara:strand:- start:11701 stop:11871 length:171 start_codon:yes stop_codon:yes gene_type:complete
MSDRCIRSPGAAVLDAIAAHPDIIYILVHRRSKQHCAPGSLAVCNQELHANKEVLA